MPPRQLDPLGCLLPVSWPSDYSEHPPQTEHTTLVVLATIRSSDMFTTGKGGKL